MDDAKVLGSQAVILWGTGTPKREFLHADDLGNACLFLLENYDGEVALNVGVGQDVSIAELAEIIRSIVGFEGTIDWDSTKPDGTPRKLLDISRLTDLGWKPGINLEDGIRSTYEWYLANNMNPLS
jgi:GDP-L-fucose synthase